MRFFKSLKSLLNRLMSQSGRDCEEPVTVPGDNTDAESTDVSTPPAIPAKEGIHVAPPVEPPRRKIIVGLGNPGPRYAHTRHNIGFDCIDRLAQSWDILLSDRRQHVVLGQGEVQETPVVLAKPRTFMNNSGHAVRYLLARFRAQPSDLVIIYDEMDLPLGIIRLRSRGGAAGHQGMASIINVLGSNKFPRVRVGIGKPESADDWIRYVLEPFREDELTVVRHVVERVAASLDSLLEEGIDRAMNRFNTTRSPSPKAADSEIDPSFPSFKGSQP